MIIGIEGVSCTGKSTLARSLAAALPDAVVIPCYYHAAPDPSRLPDPVAATWRQQLESLRILLEIEGLRQQQAVEAAAAGRDVILDRTVDTLLAHTHAVGRLHGLAPIDQAARALAVNGPVVVPQLTLLLHAPAAVLRRRAQARPGLPKVFYAADFAAHFNAYFHAPLTPLVDAIDSTPTTEVLTEQALTHIRAAHLRQSRPSRAARRPA